MSRKLTEIGLFHVTILKLARTPAESLQLKKEKRLTIWPGHGRMWQILMWSDTLCMHMNWKHALLKSYNNKKILQHNFSQFGS